MDIEQLGTISLRWVQTNAMAWRCHMLAVSAEVVWPTFLSISRWQSRRLRGESIKRNGLSAKPERRTRHFLPLSWSYSKFRKRPRPRRQAGSLVSARAAGSSGSKQQGYKALHGAVAQTQTLTGMKGEVVKYRIPIINGNPAYSLVICDTCKANKPRARNYNVYSIHTYVKKPKWGVDQKTNAVVRLCAVLPTKLL